MAASASSIVGGRRWSTASSAERCVDQRAPEIAPRQAAEVVEVLDADRAIEPVLLPEELAVRGRGRLRQEELRRVARDPDQQEDDERHPEQRRDQLDEPATEIGQHRARPEARRPGRSGPAAATADSTGRAGTARRCRRTR